MITSKLQLPNVTLICLTNQKFAEHKAAIDASCEQINFGAVKLIWDEKCTSIDEWNRKIVYELHQYINTSHALLIHGDGWVANPECWKEDWLQYDFAGSPFPLPIDDFSYRDIYGKVQRVGNSVGLRSKKLLELPAKLGLPWQPFHGFFNEDGWFSVGNRHIFEKEGCIFMPFEEALYFGREHELSENKMIDKTFVFHDFLGRNAMYK